MLADRILLTASLLSFRSEFKHKVGAVIFKGSTVQGGGYNLKRTHPLSVYYNQSDLKPYLHAEVHALINCKNIDLSKSSMLVVRVLKDGTFGTSKPCPGCTRAIMDSDLHRVYYFENLELKYITVN